MTVGFIVHAPDDTVGVAVTDLSSGHRVAGSYQDGQAIPELEVKSDVPLGHKIALTSIASGERIRKYGENIGVATLDIDAGAHVHTHNLTGERWSQ